MRGDATAQARQKQARGTSRLRRPLRDELFRKVVSELTERQQRCVRDWRQSRCLSSRRRSNNQRCQAAHLTVRHIRADTATARGPPACGPHRTGAKHRSDVFALSRNFAANGRRGASRHSTQQCRPF
eukprot:scaffold18144_cov130-Isochrysis_galbana.AAC.7